VKTASSKAQRIDFNTHSTRKRNPSNQFRSNTVADAPAFVIANFTVEDPEKYRVYEKGFFPILKKHGGEFLTYDDNNSILEGDERPEGRVVLFKFPSEKAAKAWYADPEYQALSEHRRAGTTMKFLTIVHGLPPRD